MLRVDQPGSRALRATPVTTHPWEAAASGPPSLPSTPAAPSQPEEMAGKDFLWRTPVPLPCRVSSFRSCQSGPHGGLEMFSPSLVSSVNGGWTDRLRQPRSEARAGEPRGGHSSRRPVKSAVVLTRRADPVGHPGPTVPTGRKTQRLALLFLLRLCGGNTPPRVSFRCYLVTSRQRFQDRI